MQVKEGVAGLKSRFEGFAVRMELASQDGAQLPYKKQVIGRLERLSYLIRN